ncbi:MAG: c-type cytochrome [Gammaproteobacteria bacterium]|nr:c-type cytochrome [Gammaproteobacteria bacterium]MBU2059902.1 c-type cytochrome [Gammaproteobacteria bacterium]MBU2175843.1 c-type cytochrome [Gammaproteobacteria bacterium]MBU2247666.1 c-type cytochrome [Gammaproteobacteria bacterium]MBU2346475.1 c-type cytochrome [Gammaproteobacteria bacterium]
MNRLLALVLFLLFGVLSSPLYAQSLDIQLPDQKLRWSLLDIKQKVPVQQIKLFDPVYNSDKSFVGVSLLQLLKAAGYKPGQAADEVVLTASDGYAPSMPLEYLLDDQAVLVFAETGKKDFDFAPVAQGKAMVSPAPFYLVWRQGKAVEKTRPWPYQLVKLELVSFQQRYPKLYPTNTAQSSAAYQGFLLFKQNCISCHSINLQGGDLGPELNAPKNVTEYWTDEHLKAFIPNASGYRYKSKMPTFEQFSAEDIDHLVAYLKHMKDYKIQLP